MILQQSRQLVIELFALLRDHRLEFWCQLLMRFGLVKRILHVEWGRSMLLEGGDDDNFGVVTWS